MRAAMKRGAVRHALLAARDPLALAPPARNLHWARRIVDVDDLENVAFVSLGQARRIDVAAAVIVVAVRAGAAGLEMAEPLRVFGVGEVPDEKPFLERRAGRVAPSRRDPLERGDHAPLGDLHLQRPGIGRPRQKAHEARPRRIRHLDDVEAGMPQRAGVEVPALARLVQRELEGGPIVEIGVADLVDMAAIGLARRKHRHRASYAAKPVARTWPLASTNQRSDANGLPAKHATIQSAIMLGKNGPRLADGMPPTPCAAPA